VVAEVGPVDLGGDDRLLSVKVDDGGRALVRLVRLLDGAGLAPESLAVREPTLNDVFLLLTGHPAEDAAPAEEGATK